MKTFLKVIVVIVAVLAIVCGYFYPRTQATVGASATGSTFSTAKQFSKIWAPVSASATTTSIYNDTGNSLYVTRSFFYCSGASLNTSVSSIIFSAATTSTNAPASLGNTNYLLIDSMATATPAYVATTTFTSTAANLVWPAGSYVTFSSNGTNTAVCTIGVDAIGS